MTRGNVATKGKTKSVKAVQTHDYLKPAPLKEGDQVAIVSPGSRPESPRTVALAERILRELGLKPVVGKHVLSMHGYLAGRDEQRIEDLNKAIKDSSIRAIFCTTGGYGSLRLLDKVDYTSLKRDPKICFGSDENTCLLNAINKHAGIAVFHGRNLDSIDSQESFDDIRRAITSVKALPPVMAQKGFPAGFVYAPLSGRGEGYLSGGNLSSYFSLMGTRHQPLFSERILFFEDQNERVDVLERWFTSMYLSGELAKARGVAFGNFEGCGHLGSHNLLSLEDVFSEPLRKLKIPSCFGLAIGQSGQDARTIPIGVRAALDTESGALEFLEPALVK